jgi:hypothetical protein
MDYNSTLIKFYISLREIEELAKDIPFLLDQYKPKCDEDFDEKWKNFEEAKKANFKVTHEKLRPAGAWKKYIIDILESDKIPDFLLEELKEVDAITELVVALPMKAKLDDFLREMSLVYLITIFESYLESILRITFERYPECLSSSKTITAEEVVERIRVETSILDYFVEKEIDDVMRSDIEQINNFFAKKFKIDMSKLSPNWKESKERFYRRNIILHNLGIINDEYKQKTGFTGEAIRLDVSKDYLQKSLDMFKTMGVSMGDEFKKKFDKSKSSQKTLS